MNLTRAQKFSFLRNFFTGLFASIGATVLSSQVTTLNFALIDGASYLDPDRGYWWILFVRIFSLLLNIAVVSFVYYYFDNVDLFNKKEYFDSTEKKHLLLEVRYWIYLAISLPFAAAMFSSNVRFVLSHFFYNVSYPLCYLISFLMFVGIRALQIHLLKNKWDNEILYPHLKSRSVFKWNRNMNDFKLYQLIIQPIGFYILAGISVGLLLNTLLAFFYPIVIILTLPFALLYLAAAILIISAIPFIIYTIHNIRARGKLFKYLNKLQRDHVATVKYKGKKMMSAFFPSMIFELSITHRNGKKYNISVISCGKMGSPMYFKRNEYLIEKGLRLNSGALISTRPGTGFAQAVDISKFGEDENPTNTIIGYHHAYDLSFADEEGEKTVILNPTTTRAFMVDESNKAHPIDTGTKLFDYTLYTASGFYNMMNLSK